jgi:hypothetical protein
VTTRNPPHLSACEFVAAMVSLAILILLVRHRAMIRMKKTCPKTHIHLCSQSCPLPSSHSSIEQEARAFPHLHVRQSSSEGRPRT